MASNFTLQYTKGNGYTPLRIGSLTIGGKSYYVSNVQNVGVSATSCYCVLKQSSGIFTTRLTSASASYAPASDEVLVLLTLSSTYNGAYHCYDVFDNDVNGYMGSGYFGTSDATLTAKVEIVSPADAVIEKAVVYEGDRKQGYYSSSCKLISVNDEAKDIVVFENVTSYVNTKYYEVDIVKNPIISFELTFTKYGNSFPVRLGYLTINGKNYYVINVENVNQGINTAICILKQNTDEFTTREKTATINTALADDEVMVRVTMSSIVAATTSTWKYYAYDVFSTSSSDYWTHGSFFLDTQTKGTLKVELVNPKEDDSMEYVCVYEGSKNVSYFDKSCFLTKVNDNPTNTLIFNNITANSLNPYVVELINVEFTDENLKPTDPDISQIQTRDDGDTTIEIWIYNDGTNANYMYNGIHNFYLEDYWLGRIIKTDGFANPNTAIKELDFAMKETFNLNYSQFEEIEVNMQMLENQVTGNSNYGIDGMFKDASINSSYMIPCSFCLMSAHYKTWVKLYSFTLKKYDITKRARFFKFLCATWYSTRIPIQHLKLILKVDDKTMLDTGIYNRTKAFTWSNLLQYFGWDFENNQIINYNDNFTQDARKPSIQVNEKKVDFKFNDKDLKIMLNDNLIYPTPPDTIVNFNWQIPPEPPKITPKDNIQEIKIVFIKNVATSYNALAFKFFGFLDKDMNFIRAKSQTGLSATQTARTGTAIYDFNGVEYTAEIEFSENLGKYGTGYTFDIFTGAGNYISQNNLVSSPDTQYYLEVKFDKPLDADFIKGLAIMPYANVISRDWTPYMFIALKNEYGYIVHAKEYSFATITESINSLGTNKYRMNAIDLLKGNDISYIPFNTTTDPKPT